MDTRRPAECCIGGCANTHSNNIQLLCQSISCERILRYIVSAPLINVDEKEAMHDLKSKQSKISCQVASSEATPEAKHKAAFVATVDDSRSFTTSHDDPKIQERSQVIHEIFLVTLL